MSKKRGEIIAVLSLLLIGGSIWFFRFSKMILQSNQILFDSGIDASKSYYNFSYLLKEGWQNFYHHGINAPYGDHIHYTNSHPLYLYLIKPLQDLFDWDAHAVGIINLGMLLSMLVALPFIYLLLRRFSLPRWYAIFVAIIIQFLYPQMGRMYGHFEMALAFAFPAYWYFLLRMMDAKKKWLWFLLAFSLLILNGLLSAYLIAINAVFTLALFAVEIFKNRKQLIPISQNLILLLVLALIPILSIKFFVSATDISPNRPTDPWGFYQFDSTIASVFLPDCDPIRKIVPKSWIHYRWGGRSFMGRPAAFFFLVSVLYLVYGFSKRRNFEWKKFFPSPQLNGQLTAATLVLLFSMCIPFKFGFQWLTDLFPLLKQFRALGRFSWPFYYVINVFMAYYIYVLWRYLRKSNFSWFAFSFLSISLLFWSVDALANMKWHDRNKKFTDNPFGQTNPEYENLLIQNGKKVEDFQSIMTIPFHQTHGDKMLFESKEKKAPFQALVWSYHTGLSQIQSFSPRLSFDQAETSIQMLANPLIVKERLDDMSDQEILVLVDPKYEKDHFERRFFTLLDSVCAKDDVVLYSLQPIKLKEETIKLNTEIRSNYNLSTHNRDVHYYFNGFDNLETKKATAFTGPGSLYAKKQNTVLIDTVLSDLGLVGDVEISFWNQFDYTMDNLPKKIIDVFDEEGKKVNSYSWDDRQNHDVLSHWYRSENRLNVVPGYRYKITLLGRKYKTNTDNLLIRPVDVDVFIPLAGDVLLYNNYVIH